MKKVTRRDVFRLLLAASTLKLQAQETLYGGKAASSDPSPVVCDIRAKGLSIGVTEYGHIVRLILGDKAISVPFHASTVLAGCRAGDVLSKRVDTKGGLEIVRRYRQERSRDSCLVTERLFPAGDSIRWELEIRGERRSWTTAIETQLAWLKPTDASFWTAWDAPKPARKPTENSPLADANPQASFEPWIDPLRPVPFNDRTLRYGGLIEEGDAFSLPLATILLRDEDLALTFVQSPEDRLLDMRLSTTALGDVILSRLNHRISETSPLIFGMDLVSHPADCRSALGWITQRYPRYFNSPNPGARALDGCGAYSGYDGPLDADLLKEQAFAVNWNAHFSFPFLGMSIPPVKKGVEWKSWYQTPTSLDKMEQYDASMKKSGFHVLEYFVITECGNYIEETPPPQREPVASDFWRDGNDFVHREIPDAILRDSAGKIHYSNWFGNVVVDPADPAWQKSLLRQAQTLVQELPSSAGICIDRMDWLYLYNPNGDDGCSWIDSRPARSMVNSWKETVAKISDILHPAGKVMYGNPLVRRIDTVNHLDGFYDEYGDDPRILNLVAFMSLHKPAIAWTRDINSLRPDPDALFQRHLHLGVFPTVPYPHADHTIVPDPWVNEYYADYGQMLNAIRGKRWILEPHVITCDDAHASVNLFEIPDGLAIPVTFGRQPTVVVSVCLPKPLRSRIASMEVFYPGKVRSSEPVPQMEDDGVVRIKVPLQRNCALIKLRIAPERA